MRSIAVFCFCLVTFVSATDFEDCGSTGLAISLDFEGCTTPPCVVQRGKNYAAYAYFTAAKDSATVRNTITASIAGIETPWPGLDRNGCDDLELGGTPCPVVTGSDYIWYMDVAILSDYPTITTVATIKFEGDDKLPIVCLKIPVTII